MGTVHDLLEVNGKQTTRELVEGRRGPRVVEAAANWASDEDIGTGFMYSGWCQTALPHKRPADDAAVWKLETDSMTLLVEPGIRVVSGGDPVHVGVPFGAIARLILIYLQSEALRTGSRDVELGGSLRAFLGRLGLPVGGKTTSVVCFHTQTGLYLQRLCGRVLADNYGDAGGHDRFGYQSSNGRGDLCLLCSLHRSSPL